VFSFFRAAPEKKAAEAIFKALRAGGTVESYSPLAGLDPAQQVRALLQVAAECQRIHDDDNIRDAARRAVSLDPGCWEAWKVLARIERETERFEAARNPYEQLHANDPSDVTIACEYADLLLDLKDPDRAIEVLESVKESGFLSDGWCPAG
jgi:Tfp pilus assembly protein PilF